MSLCETRNRTTSLFSFFMGTMSSRHQNLEPVERDNTCSHTYCTTRREGGKAPAWKRPPTALLVQDNLGLELPSLVQGFLHLRREALAGLAAVQEVAHAALLHQLAAAKAGQFAEAIGAVDDGVDGRDLGVAEDKVAV